MSKHREVDMPLMSISIGKFNEAKNLHSIQRIRSHLGVVHVSDVCSADGRKMDTKFFANIYTGKHRNTYDLPERRHVTKVDYTIWLKLLKGIIICKNNTLPVPLGSWIQMSTVDWVGNLGYVIPQDRKFLYHKVGEQDWQQHLQ